MRRIARMVYDGKETAVTADVAGDGRYRNDIFANVFARRIFTGDHLGIIEVANREGIRFRALIVQTKTLVVQDDLGGCFAVALRFEFVTKTVEFGGSNVFHQVALHLCKLGNEVTIYFAGVAYVAGAPFAIRFQKDVEHLRITVAVTAVKFYNFCRFIIVGPYLLCIAAHDVLIELTVVIVTIYTEQPTELQRFNACRRQGNPQGVAITSLLHVIAKGNQIIPSFGIAYFVRIILITKRTCFFQSHVVYEPARLHNFGVENDTLTAGIRFLGGVSRFFQNAGPLYVFTAVRVVGCDRRIHINTVLFGRGVPQVPFYDIPVRTKVCKFDVQFIRVGRTRVVGVDYNFYRAALQTLVFVCERSPTALRTFKVQANVDFTRVLLNVCNVGQVFCVITCAEFRKRQRLRRNVVPRRTRRRSTTVADGAAGCQNRRTNHCQSQQCRKFLFHLYLLISFYFRFITRQKQGFPANPVSSSRYRLLRFP